MLGLQYYVDVMEKNSKEKKLEKFTLLYLNS